MRRILLTAAVTLGIILVLIAGLLVYGALNLNSLVKNNRQYLLDRMGDSVGRDVGAQDVKIGLGWGVTLEITGLQVADDPSFSQLPFLKAKELSGRVELLPLLSREVLITRLDLFNPAVRILRDRAGSLNIATLGAKNTSAPSHQARSAREHATQIPIHFLAQDLTIREGAVSYQDASDSGRPLNAAHLNLELRDVNPTRPFPVKLSLAALDGTRNLSVHGTIGPLMRDGVLEINNAPLAFNITAGPLQLDRLRNIPELRTKIPDKLSMPDPFTVKASLKGTIEAAVFEVNSDLSAARLLYLGQFNKPAGTPFQIVAAGSRRGSTIGITHASVRLAALKANLTDLNFGHGSWSAKVDTNRFDLAPMAKMAASLTKYEVSGASEAHLTIASAAPMPRAQGAVALSGVGFKVEGSKLPGINDLTGTVRLNGTSAELEPTSFNLGSARAGLQGQASSLQPLRATYSFNADSFKLAELVPQRPADEQVSQLKANGTIAAQAAGVTVTTALTSGQGMVSRVPYRNLAMRATYDGRQANVTSLTLEAYGGSIGSRAQAALAPPRPFESSINLSAINLQEALTAQQAKAAAIVRGLLSGQINASGKGTSFDQIKPTLAGGGRIQITQGKLIGVNVVGSALKKINGIPAVGTLITPQIIARHPALFSSSDTDLKLMRMSYVMTGPRMTSHDITVQSDDYNVAGDGWFDMDKNVDLSLHVLMSRQFSSELQAEKKNVSYLENPGGEIEIPLLIRGTLPHPSVQPDVQFLVQRAATQAVQQQGSRLLNRYLGNKGLSKFLGGNAAGSGNPPASNPSAPNPIAPLENLFH